MIVQQVEFLVLHHAADLLADLPAISGLLKILHQQRNRQAALGFERLRRRTGAHRAHQVDLGRGKAFADLTITKATSGTISGSVTLTPEQLEALKQGKVYLQVHSEKGIAPEQGKVQPDVDNSNLWGWLLK